jgi:anti-sigma B factor antagonist
MMNEVNGVSITIHTKQVNERCAAITLAGRLDASNSQTLKESLDLLIDAGTIYLVVDLAQVPFIDSAGLAALVSTLKATRRVDGNLLLAGVQPQARTVFSLTMLDQVFAIHPDVETALDSLEADAAPPEQPNA